MILSKIKNKDFREILLHDDDEEEEDGKNLLIYT